MKLKLCGLTRIEDIEAVNMYQPDYIGFVFAESPRQISNEKAFRLKNGLYNNIKAVGVFVDSPPDVIIKTVVEVKLDVVQLHGSEDKETVLMLRQALPDTEIWKAVRFNGAESIKKAEETSPDKLLIDAHSLKGQGGTGETADWKEIARMQVNIPYILAGGLNMSNIAEAIAVTSPWGVDLSSGIETDKVKDRDKIKAITDFIKKHKETGK